MKNGCCKPLAAINDSTLKFTQAAYNISEGGYNKSSTVLTLRILLGNPSRLPHESTLLKRRAAAGRTGQGDRATPWRKLHLATTAQVILNIANYLDMPKRERTTIPCCYLDTIYQRASPPTLSLARLVPFAQHSLPCCCTAA